MLWWRRRFRLRGAFIFTASKEAVDRRLVIMAFQKLARIDEVPPGTTKFVSTGRWPVVLANWRGGIYALHGLCPHQNNPLEGAQLWENLLDCPWHHYQYDVRTGENHFPGNVYPKDLPHLRQQLKSLETYPVELRDGEIWVDLK